MKIKIKIIIILLTMLIFATGALYVLNIDLVINRDKLLKNYIEQFILAANNKDCEKLYPLGKIKNFDKDVVCPRGDVGNFVVIDKVDYASKNFLGNKFSNNRQVELDVCIQSRGVAGWNQGNYSGCKTDPLIINFHLKGSQWQPDLSNFTDISQLISKAGEKPYNFQCGSFGCYPKVGGTIEYFIRTHQLPEQGKAH